jgi:MFS family permease
MTALHRSVFLVSLPFVILSFLLPGYGRATGADVLRIGLFFSAFFLMTVLLRPVIGWGIERYGRRPCHLAGPGVYAATWAAFAFIDTPAGVMGARAGQGVASSLLWLAAYTITAGVAGQSAGASSAAFR